MYFGFFAQKRKWNYITGFYSILGGRIFPYDLSRLEGFSSKIENYTCRYSHREVSVLPTGTRILLSLIVLKFVLAEPLESSCTRCYPRQILNLGNPRPSRLSSIRTSVSSTSLDDGDSRASANFKIRGRSREKKWGRIPKSKFFQVPIDLSLGFSNFGLGFLRCRIFV